MTGKDLFKIWAPAGARWTEWVRPVPFISIKGDTKLETDCHFTISPFNYLSKVSVQTAVIVDLPGDAGIKEGLALAQRGFRPIPLYNGTNGQEGAMTLVDHLTIERALMKGAFELNKINIAPDAPPVFLLDCNRTHRFKMNVSLFDNSWDLYEQDMPSADYFLNHGIEAILIIGEKIQRDVAKLLYQFAVKGIKILFTKGYEAPKEVKLRKLKKGMFSIYDKV